MLRHLSPGIQVIVFIVFALFMGIAGEIAYGFGLSVVVDQDTLMGVAWEDPRIALSRTFFNQVFFFALSTIFFIRLVGDRWEHILVLRKFKAKEVGITIGLSILMFFALPLLSWLNEPLRSFIPESFIADEIAVNKYQESIIYQDNPIQFIFVLITMALAPAICEELAFRGFVLKKMIQSGISQNGAILMSAVIFSLSHLQPLKVIPIFVMGLCLGYLAEKFGNLKYSILFHFLINGVQITIGYLGIETIF